MPRRIGIIIPFEGKGKWMLNRNMSSIYLFAKKILDKYGVLGTYGFNDATLVFLEQLANQKQQGKDIKEQIAFTVKLMMLRQNKNYVAKEIISGHSAFQKNITNHVLVNMNRLLTVDKRIYSELYQLSRDNGKLKEAYRRIEKLENHEKKLVIQAQNQQIIKPKSLQRNFYQLFQRMFKQSQMKLSQQIFKESVARQQYRYCVNQLVEWNTWRSEQQKHEFLHVMQHGTLEERREAMEILRSAVMEVNRVTKGKEEHRNYQVVSPELLLVETENMDQNMTIWKKMSHLLKQIVTEPYFIQEAIGKNVWVGIHNQLRIGDKQIVQMETGTVQKWTSQRLLSQAGERTHLNGTSQQIHSMNNVLFSQIEKKVSNHVLNRIEHKVNNHVPHVQETELIIQKKPVGRHLETVRNHTQEKELMQLKEAFKRQEIVQIQEKHTMKEIQKQLEKQDKLVQKLVKKQNDKEKPSNIASAINRQIRSELHIDRIRYGLD